MEYEKIKQLMDDMGNSQLESIDIDFPDGTKISMKKEQKNRTTNINENQDNLMTNVRNNNIQKENIIEGKKENGNIVKSPMVGTFYIKPSPTDEAYVKVGKHVNRGDILCIIEAMKLMNEIESEYSGKIIEILVNDGQIVEYGTPLFRIGE